MALALGMDWQAIFTLVIVLVALAGMLSEFARPDLVMMAALAALAGVGILTPGETFAGFSNQAVAAIALLFVVSAALRRTGVLDMTLGRLLPRSDNLMAGAFWITAPVAALSAFLNNTPIVAMMTPAVIDWSKRIGRSPSRFLIPLSFASVLGSSTTLIGTSVNLTVAGLMDETGMPSLGFFELAWVGIPMALGGLVYLVFVVPRVLPDRVDPGEAFGDRRREYVIAMRVEPDCDLVGQSVEAAGLRNLPGLFLVEIERRDRIITPVSPDIPIRANDKLLFAGVVSTIVDLQRIRGLVPEAHFDVDVPEAHRLVEAVVSSSSPLVGRSVKDSAFRTAYDAAIIAVHRNGERVGGKIGRIVLRAGDTLLMQTSPGWENVHRNSPDFYLVSEIGDGAQPRFEKRWIALGTLVAIVASVFLEIYPIAIAAMLGAGFLLVTRCIRGPEARQSVDWSILIVIGAGFGIAEAMDKTGAARAIAQLLVAAAGDAGPTAALAAIYVICLLLAELLHHNAAAAVMFPIAINTATEVGADPRGFAIAVAAASCCAFASPVAYQAHLIVYGPGGYRFTDFVKVGIPLDLICGAIALTVIPVVWGF